jgi:hypothetical protein
MCVPCGHRQLGDLQLCGHIRSVSPIRHHITYPINEVKWDLMSHNGEILIDAISTKNNDFQLSLNLDSPPKSYTSLQHFGHSPFSGLFLYTFLHLLQMFITKRYIITHPA